MNTKVETTENGFCNLSFSLPIPELTDRIKIRDLWLNGFPGENSFPINKIVTVEEPKVYLNTFFSFEYYIFFDLEFEVSGTKINRDIMIKYNAESYFGETLEFSSKDGQRIWILNELFVSVRE